MGCVFVGAGKYVEARTLTFTLKPVKTTTKSGSPIIVTKAQTHRFASSLR